MFSESLLESSVAHHRSNRGWTTAASLAAQIMLLSALAVVPMIYPEALSLVQRTPEIPIFSSAPQPVPATPNSQRQSFAPSAAPVFIRSNGIHYGQVRPATEGTEVVPPNPSLLPPGRGPNLQLSSTFRPPVVATPPRTAPVRLSHMDLGALSHYVKPQYPQIAVQARMQGTVELHAIISKEGAIESLQVVSGHPFLARAALDAVRQWRYRPYLLNGQPVEVDTQITVNFTLDKP
jgi:protein TonB